MTRVLIAALFVAQPLWAEDTRRLSNAELYPPLPGVEYFCTDAHGNRFEIGQTICVQASCQTWMATCDMSQNNVTWRKVLDGCPTADLIETDLMDRLKALG